MNKKVSVIGIGMDGKHTLTKQAEKAILNANVLIGAKRMVEYFSGLNKAVFIEYKSDIIADYIKKCSFLNIAVLMSGDCGFYSGAQKLLLLLEDCNTDVICGISAPVYLCSKLNLSWQDMHFVSLHGTDANIVRSVCSHYRTFFLLGGSVTAKSVCKRLCEYDLGNVKVYIGENLSAENERILIGNASDFINAETSDLCVLIAENSGYEKYLLFGIPDHEFICGDVPMTKAEIRCIAVSKLKICSDDICWDIGCGTGSVSIEMALKCEHGKVYAIDKNPEAVKLTHANSRKFGCDNIKIINKDACEAAAELPAPDSVFIGGSGRKLDNIILSAISKNPQVKIVVTAVCIETLTKCTEFFASQNIECEVSQIAVTRAKKTGNCTMLSAQNPVYIISRRQDR